MKQEAAGGPLGGAKQIVEQPVGVHAMNGGGEVALGGDVELPAKNLGLFLNGSAAEAGEPTVVGFRARPISPITAPGVASRWARSVCCHAGERLPASQGCRPKLGRITGWAAASAATAGQSASLEPLVTTRFTPVAARSANTRG